MNDTGLCQNTRMPDGATDTTPSTRRRARSALLSGLAAGTTAGLLVWSIAAADASRSASWYLWIALIGIPPIVFSVAATVQYRWGRSTGAGAVAAALYWVFLITYNVRAVGLYLLGALLQTVAWFTSRPASVRTAEGAAQRDAGAL